MHLSFTDQSRTKKTTWICASNDDSTLCLGSVFIFMWVHLAIAGRTVDLPGNTKAALVQQGALSVPVWGSGGPDVNRDPAMEALENFLQRPWYFP